MHDVRRRFRDMIIRSRNKNIECEYTKSDEDFERWLIDIGPVPEGMKIATVGRHDHSQGYIKGNFSWQEKSDNSAESAKRLSSSPEFMNGQRDRRSKAFEEFIMNYPQSMIEVHQTLTEQFGYKYKKDVGRKIRNLRPDIIVTYT